MSPFVRLPVATAVLLAVACVAMAPPVQAQDETALGVDAASDGNEATSLGAIDSCASVAVDDTFDVDVFVENVVDLLAWEAYVTYDHAIVAVVDRDVELFQATGPGSSVLNVSDPVPFDQPRPFRIGATTLTDPPAGENGSGVLARLTLKALAPGRTSVSIDAVDRNEDGALKFEDDLGPYLKDSDAKNIGDADGNVFFDGPVHAAEIAVGQSCEGNALDGEVATDDDSESWRWWMTGLVVPAAALALAGLIYAYRRIRRGDTS